MKKSSENDAGRPAERSPHSGDGGFTRRERAAIDLKIPDSGTRWIDDMIFRSRAADAYERITAESVGGVLSTSPRKESTPLVRVISEALDDVTGKLEELAMEDDEDDEEEAPDMDRDKS